ncbi:beta-xylanase [Gemmatimonadetes bacterium T265]|nr:beta-xylanase [Gemmatimonadetes bacterium T265]
MRATRVPRLPRVRGALAGFAGLIGLAGPSRGAAQPAGPPQPDLAQPPQVIRLWPGRAPGALGDEDRDTPTLTLYRPFGRPYTTAGGATAGTAVIVAPGGGYAALAENHEGRQVANWFNALGVTALVLRYRLGPRYHHPVELGDVQRALRLVRARAGEFGVRADRVGVMGFSAGGHLAATAATRFDDGDPRAPDPVDRASSRPDFLVLAYPVVSFTAPYTHQGSATNLLGADAPAALRAELSAEQHVTARTPPTFLFTTNADDVVPAENSVAFYLALRRAGVPAELHVFEPGSHGAGLALADPVLGVWPALLATWLRTRGLLTRPH